MENEAMLDRLEASWSKLGEALAGIPDARKHESGPSGTWSIKDVLGHIAFWNDVSEDRVKRVLDGEEPGSGTDWQAQNDLDVARKSSWDLASIEHDFSASFPAMMTVYRQLPTIDEEAAREDWEHFDEHAADILAWREREGI